MKTNRKTVVLNILAVCFGVILIAGCADLFAPGLRQGVERLKVDFAEVAEAQGGLVLLVEEGQVILTEKIKEAKESIETINFRSEEDKAGAVAMLESLEGKVNSFFTKAGEEAGKLDSKVSTLFNDTKTIREALAEANTPAEGLTVLGSFLTPMLGPYAPLGEFALGILGLGATGRTMRRRGEKHGITGSLAPIEKARHKDLEKMLNEKDPSRKFIVFDSNITKPQFDSNGVASVLDTFSALADRN